MLLQFTVENFKSFRHEAVLSLETQDDKEADVVLKSAAIYGANAAGKSNLLKAISMAVFTVRQSNVRQPGESMPWIAPFDFCNETRNEPSKFEFVYEIDSNRYVYRFSATKEKIIAEELYTCAGNNARLIFDRDSSRNQEYNFGSQSIEKELAPIVERNTENKLFLSTGANWNSKILQAPFRWFFKVATYSSLNHRTLLQKATASLDNDEDGKLKEFVLRLLHAADINIYDYRLDRRDVATEDIVKNIPLPISELISKYGGEQQRMYSVDMVHRIQNENGEVEVRSLNLQNESEGTQVLFALGPTLMEVFSEGSILCIDEFSTSLHPILASYIVDLFNNPQINRNNAQLIVATHVTELLALAEQRREQVYFVDKNYDNGESELYSLDEFESFSEQNINRDYLLGRFGAVPHIYDGDLS